MSSIVDACYENGIATGFIEKKTSTEWTLGKIAVQILIAVAETEWGRILERNNKGRLAAILSRVTFERKPHRQSDMVWELVTQNTPERLYWKNRAYRDRPFTD